MKLKIDHDICQKWPQFKLGVVVASQLTNKKSLSVAVEVLEELRKTERDISQIADETPIGQLPKIAPWRQAYKEFGAKGGERSSVEALLRRARAGKLLPDINPLVNLYNFLSLKHQLPVGGEDLRKVQGNVLLKLCNGTEKGTYIGGKEEVSCSQGEVAYCDDAGFICRYWNWREAKRTMLDEETQSALLVIESLPPVTTEELHLALDEMKYWITERFHGKVQASVLDCNSPEIEINAL